MRRMVPNSLLLRLSNDKCERTLRSSAGQALQVVLKKLARKLTRQTRQDRQCSQPLASETQRSDALLVRGQHGALVTCQI